MALTLLTVLAAAALGSGVAAGLSALVIIAGVALALLALVNGLRTLADLFSELGPGSSGGVNQAG